MSTALPGDTGNGTITEGDKWRGATTVELHEFSDSVDTKNIFMTTPMRTQLG